MAIQPQIINEWLEAQTPSDKVVRVEDVKYEGVEINESNELVAIPVVYGRRRIIGPRIFASVAANNSSVLYAAIALSEGPIYGIDGFYINDEAVNLPIFTTGVQSIGSGTYGGILSVELRLGNPSQPASTLLSEILGSANLTGFTNSVANMAYFVLKMTYKVGGPYKEFPKVSCIVQGRKLRNAATSGFGTEQNVLRDANPADVLLDMLTNTRYGRGLADSKIDATSISSLRSSFATTVVPYINGTPVARGCVNWIMNTGQSTLANLQDLCRQFGIMLTLSNGKYRFVPEYATTGSVLTVNDTNTIGTRTEIHPDLGVKYNRVSVTFSNELNYYNENVETVSDSTGESNDGKILDVNVNFDGITSPYLARIAAEQILRKSRNQITYNFTLTKTGLQLTVGDVITYYGLTVRVTSINIDPDFTVSVSAVTHSNSLYPPYTAGQAFVPPNEIAPTPGINPPVELPYAETQGKIDLAGGTVLFNARGTDFYAGPIRILDATRTTFANSNYALDTGRAFVTQTGVGSYGIDTRVLGSTTSYFYYAWMPYITFRIRDLGNASLGGEGLVLSNGTVYPKIFYVYEIDTVTGSKFGWFNIHPTTSNSQEFMYFDPASSTSVRRVLNGVTTNNLSLINCVNPRASNPTSESIYGCPYLNYVGQGFYATSTTGSDPQNAVKWIIKDVTSSTRASSVRNWIIPATVQSAKDTLGAVMELRYFVMTTGGTPIFLASQNINVRSISPGFTGMGQFVTISRTNYKTATGITAPF